MRTRLGGRRTFVAVAGMLLAVLLGLPGAVAAEEDPPLLPPDASVYQELVANQPAGVVADEPSATELDASQDAHTGLSGAAALEVAEQEFANVLEAQLIPELELPADQEIDKFLDPYTARISDGEWEPRPESEEPNPNLLVEGTLPLRAPEGGEQELLDAELVAADGHFEAENPIVTAEIGAEVSDGVALPEAEVAIAPADVAAAQAEPVADKVFYANADTDTDYLIAPTATGAQIFAQLRSAGSPESLPLDVELPAGAVLEPTAEGGAIVRDAEGEPLVAVSPPAAWDAAGRQVPIDYAIAGERITMQVPHASAAEFLYPIMVDPVVDQYNWGQGQTNLDHREWWWGTSNANDFNPVEDTSLGAGGLRTNARAPRTFAAGSYGQWIANSIRDSWIERVDFFNFDHTPTSPGACTTLGIWMPDQYQWAPVTIQDPNGDNPITTTGSYANICGSRSHETRKLWVGSSPTPDGPYGDAEPWDHSMGIFALTSSAGNRASQASNLLRSAYVYRYDRNNPTITSSAQPSWWIKKPTFTVRDPGLGAAGVWIWGPGMKIVGSGAVYVNGHHCTGAHQHVCPVDGAATVDDLPEGKGSYVAVGIDPILNGSPGQNWTARIDRSPPTVELGGSLYANRNSLNLWKGQRLDVTAYDGSRASDSQMRSGVKSVEIRVDGSPVQAPATQNCAPPDGDGSCSLSTSWAPTPGSLAPGTHSVAIAVEDMAGNKNPIAAPFAIEVLEDDTEPEVAFTPGPVNADGTQSVAIRSTDPGADASGIAAFDVYVDGVQTESASQSVCGTPECELTKTVVLPKPLVSTELGVIGYDRAGNAHVEVGEARALHYDHFGYSDQVYSPAAPPPTNALLANARASGATVYRFGINWCETEANKDNPTWWPIDNAVNDINAHGMLAIPMVYNAPEWARGGSVVLPPPDPQNPKPQRPCDYVVPPERDDGTIGQWKEFVGSVAQRYGPDKLAALELWNEPNFVNFWYRGTTQPFDGGQPERFVELVNAGSNAIQDVRPNLRIFAGGLAPLPTKGGTSLDHATYMKRVTDPNSPATTQVIEPTRIDGISIHLYADGVEEDREAIAKIADKYRVLTSALPSGTPDDQAHSWDRKPRWITEIGFPAAESDPDTKWGSEKKQRRRLTATFLDLVEYEKVKAFMVYKLWDPLDSDGTQPNKPYGITRPSGEPRPAYCPLAKLVPSNPALCS